MISLFVGAGQAGCGLVDRVVSYENVSSLVTPVAVNSTIQDLQNLSTIERTSWLGVTPEGELVNGTEPGFEEQVEGGFGRKPRRADEIASGMVDTMAREFDEIVGDTPRYAFVFVGLGGGTGCGIAPHVIDAIQSFAERETRIITVAVLPNTSGETSRDDDRSAVRQATNAIYGLDRLEPVSDGIILIDNHRLAYEDAAQGQFSEFNRYVASGIVDLISGPVLENVDPGTVDDFEAQQIELSDIHTTLDLQNGTGYATLCRSVMKTQSLAGYLLPFVGKQSIDGDTLAQLAISKRSVADLQPGLARKAIGQVRAPERYVTDSDDQIKVSIIRRRLDSYCPEVNTGMVLTERNLASFTALLTFDRADIPRLAEIERLATDSEVAGTV